MVVLNLWESCKILNTIQVIKKSLRRVLSTIFNFTTGRKQRALRKVLKSSNVSSGVWMTQDLMIIWRIKVDQNPIRFVKQRLILFPNLMITTVHPKSTPSQDLIKVSKKWIPRARWKNSIHLCLTILTVMRLIDSRRSCMTWSWKKKWRDVIRVSTKNYLPEKSSNKLLKNLTIVL